MQRPPHHDFQKIMETHIEHEPWFGLEQENTLLGLDNYPYAWPLCGFPRPKGFTIAVLAPARSYIVILLICITRHVLYDGVKTSETYGELMPAQ